MESKDVSRRSFLKKATLFSAVAPTILNSVQAATPRQTPVRNAAANERVNLAVCGIGARGADVIRDFNRTGLCNIVALCDVDMGAPHTTRMMEQYPNAQRFKDFREMLDKMGNQIDAVAANTPDHAHFPICVAAMQSGKHIFVEKPLGRTFLENELLIKLAQKYPNLVTQMGNQGHSEGNYFQFKTWVESGIIKDVTDITAHMNSARRWHGWDVNMKRFLAAEPIPPTMDWELWLQAAQYNPYNKDYVNGQWRCWYEYGMGALGDWGAHLIDTAHEFLNLGLPYQIDPVKLDGHNPFFFPMSSTIKFRFAERGDMPPCDITWYDGVNNLPPIPEGFGVAGLDPNIPPPSSGTLEASLNPGKIIYSKTLTFKGGSHGSTLSIIPEEKAREMAPRLPQVPASPSNHFANFLLACKGQEKTRSPFEISGPLSQVFSLGVIAQRLNMTLDFDTKEKVFTNSSIANHLLAGPPPRKGWEQFFDI